MIFTKFYKNYKNTLSKNNINFFISNKNINYQLIYLSYIIIDIYKKI